MKKIFLLLLLFSGVFAVAQPVKYTVANAHSHNDYEQSHPFWWAWNAGFGSIEADIFLVDGKLIVAHYQSELALNRSLDSLYLQPLQSVIRKNNGTPYPDKTKELQLLIDIKTDSVNTLNKLIEVLKQYPEIINNTLIKIAITGNRPAQEYFTSYPSFIWFDGEAHKTYSEKALTKIVMLSDNFKNYSHWNGIEPLSTNDSAVLKNAIEKAHTLKKKIRFWNAPDNTNTWKTLMRLGVGYINTDHIQELENFLKEYGSNYN
jgi:alkaline phosphatase